MCAIILGVLVRFFVWFLLGESLSHMNECVQFSSSAFFFLFFKDCVKEASLVLSRQMLDWSNLQLLRLFRHHENGAEEEGLLCLVSFFPR